MKYNTYLFDLDGVIVNTDSIQYNTIKEAIHNLLHYDISIHNELDSIFKSTITSIDKLRILSNYISIDAKMMDIIYMKKKELANLHFSKLAADQTKIELMQYLKTKNCKIAIVTNSNKKSANIILQNIGIHHFMDAIITNEDVVNTKPSPEPYLKAIEILGASVEDCIIFEDSDVGIESANNSGCDVYRVDLVTDVNIDLIHKLNS